MITRWSFHDQHQKNAGFFILFYFYSIRDGPDTSSSQLGVFSGNTALESAYSTSPQVLIRFHSDFSTGGFFILNFHGNLMFTSRYWIHVVRCFDLSTHPFSHPFNSMRVRQRTKKKNITGKLLQKDWTKCM